MCTSVASSSNMLAIPTTASTSKRLSTNDNSGFSSFPSQKVQRKFFSCKFFLKEIANEFSQDPDRSRWAAQRKKNRYILSFHMAYICFHIYYTEAVLEPMVLEIFMGLHISDLNWNAYDMELHNKLNHTTTNSTISWKLTNFKF